MSQINLLRRSLSLNEESPHRSRVYFYTSLILITYLVLISSTLAWFYWLNRLADQSSTRIEALRLELGGLRDLETKYRLFKTRTSQLDTFIKSRESLKLAIEQLADTSQSVVSISDLTVTANLPNFDMNLKLLATDPNLLEQYYAQIPNNLTKTVNSYTRVGSTSWQSELAIKYASQSASKVNKP
jgi:hypothetical protein